PCRAVSDTLFCTSPPPCIYTLSLHDALPISGSDWAERAGRCDGRVGADGSAGSDGAEWPGGCDGSFGSDGSAGSDRAERAGRCEDRKSTRLNSSHQIISYAVFCLKKKTIKQK